MATLATFLGAFGRISRLDVQSSAVDAIWKTDKSVRSTIVGTYLPHSDHSKMADAVPSMVGSFVE